MTKPAMKSAARVRISVIVPVYNVAPFLRDCLDSVLRQTTGDWECVCVDDGSTDESGAICDEYASADSRFHVIHQRNQGLSAARNAALDWLDRNSPAESVTFLDSDDWIAPNALEELLHGAALGDGVAAFPFQEVDEKAHPSGNLDAVRWQALSIDDLWTSKSIIGSTAWGKVFPKRLFSDIRFPVGKLHEDEWTTYRALFRVERAALADAPLYFYRQRTGSIVSRPWTLKRLDALDAVAEQMEFFHGCGKTILESRCRDKLARLCRESLASIAKSGSRRGSAKCRRLLRRCLRRRINRTLLPAHNPVYRDAYPLLSSLRLSFPAIDGEVSRIIHAFHEAGVWGGIKSIFFRPWKKKPPVPLNDAIPLQYVQLRNGSMELLGHVPETLPSGARLCLHGKREDRSVETDPAHELRFAGRVVSGRAFRIAITPDFPDGVFSARLSEKADDIPFVAGPRFPISRRYRFQRLRAPDGRELRIFRNGLLRIDRPCALRRSIRTLLFFAELFWKWTEQDWYAAFLRMAFAVWRRRNPGRIWLFSDKLTNPIDNAYATALALVSGPEFKKEKVSAWYVVDGKHSLRIRLVPGIRTVRYQSRMHRFLHLAAEANVTSEGGYNPFHPLDPYEDLLAWQLRVFTDHGIIHHDLSALYGRDFNGFNLVLSGAPRERADIASGLWGYADDEVALTGLPRWDARSSAPNGTVYFGFTWRNNLVDGVDNITYERSYGERFRQSDYLARLRALMSDVRLRDTAKTSGCRLVFLPHPLLRSVLSEFALPDWVETVPADKPYEEIYRDASMLVTDYSSVAMDMAYLGKPIVYYQFDRDEFYATQGYTPSFWSWEDDGFGPVTATLDETVDAIVSAIQAGFVRKPEYERRAKEFFIPRDKENGARACRAIFARIAKTGGIQ